MKNTNIIIEYINSLPLENNIKKMILSPDLIKKNEFYINLVDYLRPIYKNISEKKLNILTSRGVTNISDKSHVKELKHPK